MFDDIEYDIGRDSGDEQPTYKVIKFYREEGKSSEVVERGLTLDEAQEICNSASTKGEDWFYGYTAE